MRTTDPGDAARIELLLAELRLPAIKLVWASLAAQADKEGWRAGRFLAALAEHEIAERSRRRLDMALAAGDAWLNNGANLLLFGPPGGGKSHLAAALGFALVENGWRVLFTRTIDLVHRLQIARRDLALEAAIAKLDKFHLLILDDIAYVTKDQAETSVLFELISARYERRSLLITANQPFGEWGKIFPDQAMTVAVVDRLVHHATIFEMNVESYRRRAALERKRSRGRRPTRQSQRMLDCRAATLNTDSPPLRDSYAATIMPLPRCRISILTVAGLIEIAALHRAARHLPIAARRAMIALKAGLSVSRQCALKHEWVYLRPAADGIEQKRSLGEFFDWYNLRRPHQAFGWRTPDEAYLGQSTAASALTA
jgi:DNA replication protein DnaC